MMIPCRQRRTTILNQQTDHDVQIIARKWNVDPEGLCGFLSLAICGTSSSDDAVAASLCSCHHYHHAIDNNNADDDLTTTTTTTTTKTAILERLDTILQWIVKRREAYIETHPMEFVAEGADFVESQGRMSRSQYRQMMCSAVEIAEYLVVQHQQQNQSKPTEQVKQECRSVTISATSTNDDDLEQEEQGLPPRSPPRLSTRSRCRPRTAFLRAILEGPVVDEEESIRFFPSSSSSCFFVSEEDSAYLAQERVFHDEQHPVDYYIQIVGDNDNDSTLMKHNDDEEVGRHHHQQTEESLSPLLMTVDGWLTKYFGSLLSPPSSSNNKESGNNDSLVDESRYDSSCGIGAGCHGCCCWNIIIDGHGHFMTLHVEIRRRTQQLKRDKEEEEDKEEEQCQHHQQDRIVCQTKTTTTKTTTTAYEVVLLHEIDTIPFDTNNMGYMGTKGCKFLKQAIIDYVKGKR